MFRKRAEVLCTPRSLLPQWIPIVSIGAMNLFLFIFASLFGISISAPVCDNRWETTGTTCSGGPQPGATKLANFLKRTYGGRFQVIYHCRNIADAKQSLHGEGRAIDHFVTGPQGDHLFNRMQGVPGVQEVIFNRRIWTKANGVQEYTGQNPHIDHVHIGLNWCGAQNYA